jgi:hypothetical protein
LLLLPAFCPKKNNSNKKKNILNKLKTSKYRNQDVPSEPANRGAGGFLKGTVQRKLRGVQNGINRKVLLLTCGAGHLFQFFFSLHPLISIKQLSATTAERIGVVY